MKEFWEMKRTRQKHLLITFMVDTLGNISFLCSVCGSYWQPCMLPMWEPGMKISYSCDPWPSAPDRWVTRRQSSTGVFATCLHQESYKPDTVDISPGSTGRIHPVSSFPLRAIYFHKADYLSYCSHGCASWTSVVHMWLPGRGPSACRRLAWASRKQAQTVQMCRRGAGGWVEEESGCPHGMSPLWCFWRAGRARWYKKHVDFTYVSIIMTIWSQSPSGLNYLSIYIELKTQVLQQLHFWFWFFF